MALDLIEVARIARHVLDPELARLRRDVLIPVSRVRMIAQPFRTARAALLLDRLEHVRHVDWVVAGARHDVGAFDVGVVLELAAEPEKRGAEPEARTLRDDVAPDAADHGSE